VADTPPRRSINDRRPRRSHRSRRLAVTLTVAVICLAALAVAVVSVRSVLAGPKLSPLRSSIVSIAEGQVGYQTDPPNSYCNQFSAHWGTGTADCGPGLRSEEWCADFAAWVWQQAGALVTFGYTTGDLSPSSASFYTWGVDHGTWHPLGDGYQPRPGDVAVYGLNVTTLVAVHVAVVIGYTEGDRGPDVVNGDGDKTGFSVVEEGSDQYQADTHGDAAPLSGYVSPTPAPATG
jgi:hypothetical protein